MTAPRVRTVGDRVAEDLRAAVEVLRRDGWSRGQLHDAETGSHDTTGAIFVATGYHQRQDDGPWLAQSGTSAGRRASEAIRWAVHCLPVRVLYDWDEDACENVDQAVDALEAAAASAERALRDPRAVERLLP